MRYLKVGDVAKLLDVSHETVRLWCVNGKIPHIRMNRVIRIPIEGFEDAMKKFKIAYSLPDDFVRESRKRAVISAELDEILG